MTVTLVLPFPPSVNAMYSNRGRSRCKSAKYRTWLDAAYWALRKQYNDKSMGGEVMLQIALKAPDNRRRDLDNHAKAIQDALTGKVLRDDSQIKLLFLWWEDNIKGGEARVMIDPMDSPLATSYLRSFDRRNNEKPLLNQSDNANENKRQDGSRTPALPDISTETKGVENA